MTAMKAAVAGDGETSLVKNRDLGHFMRLLKFQSAASSARLKAGRPVQRSMYAARRRSLETIRIFEDAQDRRHHKIAGR